eukprot:TRINITY_DN2835_c1_g1_i1.p1 TRINITY_DN2835_c1_g1~~TRINITY_DN2835_c1_g1_i1.p1  ORF type:complete len:2250 (+),score=256.19 TRINITY_DN2835_c1_g1_i1:158-6907(+)
MDPDAPRRWRLSETLWHLPVTEPQGDDDGAAVQEALTDEQWLLGRQRGLEAKVEELQRKAGVLQTSKLVGLIPEPQVAVLREAMEDPVDKAAFIAIMTDAVSANPNVYYPRHQIEECVEELYYLIDVDGGGEIDWGELTHYVLHSYESREVLTSSTSWEHLQDHVRPADRAKDRSIYCFKSQRGSRYISVDVHQAAGTGPDSSTLTLGLPCEDIPAAVAAGFSGGCAGQVIVPYCTVKSDVTIESAEWHYDLDKLVVSTGNNQLRWYSVVDPRRHAEAAEAPRPVDVEDALAQLRQMLPNTVRPPQEPLSRADGKVYLPHQVPTASVIGGGERDLTGGRQHVPYIVQTKYNHVDGTQLHLKIDRESGTLYTGSNRGKIFGIVPDSTHDVIPKVVYQVSPHEGHPITGLLPLPSTGAKRIVSAGLDSNCFINDVEAGVVERALRRDSDSAGKSALVRNLSYSREYSLLVTSGFWDMEPALWTPLAGQFISTLKDLDNPHKHRIVSVQCVASDEEVGLLPGDVRNLRPWHLVTADEGGVVKLWDIRRSSVVQTFHLNPTAEHLSKLGDGGPARDEAPIEEKATDRNPADDSQFDRMHLFDVAVDSKRGWLLSSLRTDTERVTMVHRRTTESHSNPDLAHDAKVSHILHNSFSGVFLTVSGCDVRVWDEASGLVVATHESVTHSTITAIAVDSNCRRYIVGCHDGTTSMRTLATGGLAAQFPRAPAEVTGAFESHAQEGVFFVIAGQWISTYRESLATCEISLVFKQLLSHPITASVQCSNLTYFAVGDTSETVTVFDTSARMSTKLLASLYYDGPISDHELALNAGGGDDEDETREIDDQVRGYMHPRRAEISALAPCDPYALLAAGDTKGYVTLWTLRPHREPSRVAARWKLANLAKTPSIFPVPTAFSFSSGRLFICDDQGYLTVYSLKAIVGSHALHPTRFPNPLPAPQSRGGQAGVMPGVLLTYVQAHARRQPVTSAVSFIRGRVLATASAGGDVQLFDAAGAERVGSLQQGFQQKDHPEGGPAPEYARVNALVLARTAESSDPREENIDVPIEKEASVDATLDASLRAGSSPRGFGSPTSCGAESFLSRGGESRATVVRSPGPSMCPEEDSVLSPASTAGSARMTLADSFADSYPPPIGGPRGGCFVDDTPAATVASSAVALMTPEFYRQIQFDAADAEALFKQKQRCALPVTRDDVYEADTTPKLGAVGMKNSVSAATPPPSPDTRLKLRNKFVTPQGSLSAKTVGTFTKTKERTLFQQLKTRQAIEAPPDTAASPPASPGSAARTAAVERMKVAAVEASGSGSPRTKRTTDTVARAVRRTERFISEIKEAAAASALASHDFTADPNAYRFRKDMTEVVCRLSRWEAYEVPSITAALRSIPSAQQSWKNLLLSENPTRNDWIAQEVLNFAPYDVEARARTDWLGDGTEGDLLTQAPAFSETKPTFPAVADAEAATEETKVEVLHNDHGGREKAARRGTRLRLEGSQEPKPGDKLDVQSPVLAPGSRRSSRRGTALGIPGDGGGMGSSSRRGSTASALADGATAEDSEAGGLAGSVRVRRRSRMKLLQRAYAALTPKMVKRKYYTDEAGGMTYKEIVMDSNYGDDDLDDEAKEPCSRDLLEGSLRAGAEQRRRTSELYFNTHSRAGRLKQEQEGLGGGAYDPAHSHAKMKRNPPSKQEVNAMLALLNASKHNTHEADAVSAAMAEVGIVLSCDGDAGDDAGGGVLVASVNTSAPSDWGVFTQDPSDTTDREADSQPTGTSVSLVTPDAEKDKGSWYSNLDKDGASQERWDWRTTHAQGRAALHAQQQRLERQRLQDEADTAAKEVRRMSPKRAPSGFADLPAAGPPPKVAERPTTAGAPSPALEMPEFEALELGPLGHGHHGHGAANKIGARAGLEGGSPSVSHFAESSTSTELADDRMDISGDKAPPAAAMCDSPDPRNLLQKVQRSQSASRQRPSRMQISGEAQRHLRMSREGTMPRTFSPLGTSEDSGLVERAVMMSKGAHARLRPLSAPTAAACVSKEYVPPPLSLLNPETARAPEQAVRMRKRPNTAGAAPVGRGRPLPRPGTALRQGTIPGTRQAVERSDLEQAPTPEDRLQPTAGTPLAATPGVAEAQGVPSTPWMRRLYLNAAMNPGKKGAYHAVGATAVWNGQAVAEPVASGTQPGASLAPHARSCSLIPSTGDARTRPSSAASSVRTPACAPFPSDPRSPAGSQGTAPTPITYINIARHSPVGHLMLLSSVTSAED